MLVKILNSLAASDLLSNLTGNEISIAGAATATIGRMHVCSGTSTDYTLALPAVAGNAGRLLGVRMAPGLTKIVTLDGDGTELIDGATTRLMWATEVAILLCDGVGWTKIGGKSIPLTATMATSSISQLFSNGAWTKINCNAFVAGFAGMNDVTANKQLILKRAGTYFLSANVAFGSSNATATRNIVSVYKNGVQISGAVRICYAAANMSLPAQLTHQTTLIAGDVGLGFDLRGYFESGSYTTSTISTTANYDTFLTLTEIPQW